MNKPLTHQLIAAKTKTEQIQLIKSLNLWGNDIDDLKILNQMPNLEILSLSVNKITTLKDLVNCHKLQELYLRKNCISNISEINYLQNLQNLRVLWLLENPCAEIPNYRQIVIKALPRLQKLDNTIISPEERSNSQNVNIDDIISPDQENNENQMSPPQQKYYDYQQPYYQQPQQPYPQLDKHQSENYEDRMDNSRLQRQQSEPEKHRLSKQNFYNNDNSNELSQYQQYKNQFMQQQQQVHAVEPQKPQQKMSYPYQEPYQPQAQNQPSNQQNLLQQSPYSQKGSDRLGQEMYTNARTQEQRNDNIVCAVIALLKELDENSLEVVKKEVDRRVDSMRQSRKF